MTTTYSLQFYTSFALTIFAQTDSTKTPWIELNGYIKDMQSTYFIQKIDSNASDEFNS